MLLAHGAFATLSIFEVRVAAIDQNVAGGQIRREFAQHLIYGIARLDHHQNPPRPRQRLREILQAFGAHDPAGGVLGDKAVHPFRFEVPYRNAFPMIFNIESEILAHDAQSDNAELRRLYRSSRSAHIPPHFNFEFRILNFDFALARCEGSAAKNSKLKIQTSQCLITPRASFATFSAVKPKCLRRSLIGAEAPKLSRAMTRPSVPTAEDLAVRRWDRPASLPSLREEMEIGVRVLEPL